MAQVGLAVRGLLGFAVSVRQMTAGRVGSGKVGGAGEGEFLPLTLTKQFEDRKAAVVGVARNADRPKEEEEGTGNFPQTSISDSCSVASWLLLSPQPLDCEQPPPASVPCCCWRHSTLQSHKSHGGITRKHLQAVLFCIQFVLQTVWGPAQ